VDERDTPAVLEKAIRHGLRSGLTELSVIGNYTEIGPLHAETQRIVSYNQYGRPAEEATNQERLRQQGETQRFGISEGKIYLVLAALLGVLAVRIVKDGVVDLSLVALIVLVLGGHSELLQKFLERRGLV
jgi:hypothetical protein